MVANGLNLFFVCLFCILFLGSTISDNIPDNIPEQPVVDIVEQPVDVKPELSVNVLRIGDLITVRIISYHEFIDIRIDDGSLIVSGDVNKEIELSKTPLRIFDKQISGNTLTIDLIEKGDLK